MLRLAGLPPVATAPRVRVALDGPRLVLRFLRAQGGVTRFDVPLYTLGEGADPQEAQLRLLAGLAGLGYEAEPGGPEGDGEGDDVRPRRP
jgi:hypothetical protein